jgi:Flp pilus assembly protein TadG
MQRSLADMFRSFLADRQGNIALTFALFSIPTTLVVGMAIDYGVMNRAAVQLQAAVDGAVLAGASAAGDGEALARQNFFAMAANMEGANAAGVTFSRSGSTLKATATITVNTSVMKLAGIDRVTVTREASAATATSGTADISDRSCILATGISNDASHNAILVQAGASVALSGCELRSHTSMDCDGLDTGASAILAGGTATGCNNAKLNQAAIPDIYKDTVRNIEMVCGPENGGATWTPADGFSGSATVVPVTRSGYREIHICGPLTISGSGLLNGDDPAEDLVIVVENGGVELADNVVIDARRVTFVMAGGSGSATLAFPNAAAKAATLTISPSILPLNPWAGISLYQNPSLASGIDMQWKGGANVQLDGIAYLPHAKLTIAGSLASGASGCSKLVAGEIALQGKINLTQTPAGCEKLQARQYYVPGKAPKTAHLTQ